MFYPFFPNGAQIHRSSFGYCYHSYICPEIILWCVLNWKMVPYDCTTKHKAGVYGYVTIVFLPIDGVFISLEGIRNLASAHNVVGDRVGDGVVVGRSHGRDVGIVLHGVVHVGSGGRVVGCWQLIEATAGVTVHRDRRHVHARWPAARTVVL